MRVLGLSAFYHDSAAALVADGRIVAAAEEERFTRKKHDRSFPAHAIRYCLSEGGVGLSEVDHVAFYDKPFLKFERLLETAPSHRRNMTEEEGALFGIGKLNVSRADIPAVTHVDYSARVQTVHAEPNPRFHALLRRFNEITGCPVIVNTSFNVLRKDAQSPLLKVGYSNDLEFD